MDKICFETKLYEINSWRILQLPKHSSAKLPSRGMVMISGTLNDIYFETALEPDGMGSHWFRVNDSLSQLAKVKAGDSVSLQVEPMKNWNEPDIPVDLYDALTNANLLMQWDDLTTKARWEWIRWIRSTNITSTRIKRIEVACSKLDAGMRRPCCFNQSQCTETAVSKNGILLLND